MFAVLEPLRRWWPQSPVDPAASLNALVRQFRRLSISDPKSETRLYEKLSLQSNLAHLGQVSGELAQLLKLRGLAFGKGEGAEDLFKILLLPLGKKRQIDFIETDLEDQTSLDLEGIERDVTAVSALLENLERCCSRRDELGSFARELYLNLFDVAWTEGTQLGSLIRTIRSHHGILWLLTQTIKAGYIANAKCWAVDLLGQKEFLGEQTATALYWMVELHWFAHDRTLQLKDVETGIRYLYHVCFTNPDRTGVLEIDSHFYSQFDKVNELAREAFVFKEVLIDCLLELWSENESQFSFLFQKLFEGIFQVEHRTYRTLTAWRGYWKKEKEKILHEELSLVEGNIYFYEGHYGEALHFYQQALEVRPTSRAALYNSLFCYAKLGDWTSHSKVANHAIEFFAPNSLAVVANSFLLGGKENMAREIAMELRGVMGWDQKVDYYLSSFAYEQRLYPVALEYALKAVESNPHSATFSYHLSLCYQAMGAQKKALEALKQVSSLPDLEWLHYYRFTLERDAGLTEEATQTLLGISVDYFEDPEERETALEFARLQRNFVLLRHLKKAFT